MYLFLRGINCVYQRFALEGNKKKINVGTSRDLSKISKKF